jgi:hypothetical protein
MPSVEAIVVAVAVPTAIAILGVLSSKRIAEHSLQHQRRISDLDAARNLLDQGAPLLQRATELVITACESYRRYGPETFAVPPMAETFDSLDNAADEVGALCLRLDIRLGPSHQCGKSLELMHGSLGQILGGLRRSRLGLVPTSEQQTEDAERIGKAKARYFSEMAAYIVADHRTIGAELPGVDRAYLQARDESPRPGRLLLRRFVWSMCDYLPLPAGVARRIEGIA